MLAALTLALVTLTLTTTILNALSQVTLLVVLQKTQTILQKATIQQFLLTHWQIHFQEL